MDIKLLYSALCALCADVTFLCVLQRKHLNTPDIWFNQESEKYETATSVELWKIKYLFWQAGSAEDRFLFRSSLDMDAKLFGVQWNILLLFLLDKYKIT